MGHLTKERKEIGIWNSDIKNLIVKLEKLGLTIYDHDIDEHTQDQCIRVRTPGQFFYVQYGNGADYNMVCETIRKNILVAYEKG